MTTKQAALKFFYNGIRLVGERKLCKVWYSVDSGKVGISAAAWSGARFPSAIAAELAAEIRNDSDSMTDYYDADRCSLSHGDRHFAAALAAAIKSIERGIARCERKGISSNVSIYSRELARAIDLRDHAELWAQNRARIAEGIAAGWLDKVKIGRDAYGMTAEDLAVELDRLEEERRAA